LSPGVKAAKVGGDRLPTIVMSPSIKDRGQSIENMRAKLLGQVLDAELSELTRFKRLLHSSLKIVILVARDFIQNLVKLQAMALAFKTLLSLAPLLAVVFSLLKAFGVHNRMEPALAEALAPLGEKGQEITRHLIGFVNQMSAGALGSIGLVTLFITVLSLMGTIEEAFNHIWRVKAPRKLARRFTDYLSAILVGPVLVFAAVTITATLQSHAIVQALLSFQGVGFVILSLLRLVPYLTLWGAFSFVYVFIPNTRVRLGPALVGGFVAAVLWQTVGWGFAVFVASSTRYYVIYSSFAIFLLFLLWLHISWVIVLLGAQVSYAHQHIHYFSGERDALAQNAAGREKLGLLMMLQVGQRFRHGQQPLTVAEVAAQLCVPAGVVKELLIQFTERKLLLSLADEDSFVLGRDPATIGIKEIIDCVRGVGKDVKARSKLRENQEKLIDGILLEAEQAAARSWEEKTLQTLVLALEPTRH
jgi:membrane protein